ncbi:uncharacterized protein TrAtP1_010860 [Trichoderma atroviride]|uniref:Uncharacterized protein n=1 Tax=Hypocrea atroviridis (strain ATCC 20476 / IMI 206040) TaxID=452589 RepID=G9NIK1_HYPAI|nr:uncharacterized protein TRIATDRAFT_213127 [Trichoderma atroviride IMI 206040]EHK49612.1 hypothetical protein TRIATDRAFT_213127 [Trichoderma atroviride IMI 206040]UKZ69855.1 hypothetical protein TrAtP1_010860 [Trichoderma atroviride]
MPTLRERKNPNPTKGTKVDLGKDAPVSQEAAGLVKGGSLAAESYGEGGEFDQNRNAQPEGVSGSRRETSFLEDAANLQRSGGRQAKSAVAGAAPMKDTKGPHGRKIKEGFSSDDKDSDGLQRALRAEPGSEDDPSRLAERQMLQGNSLGARGAGPRQGEMAGETRYDVLKNEVDS